jgi:hypothetical protein
MNIIIFLNGTCRYIQIVVLFVSLFSNFKPFLNEYPNYMVEVKDLEGIFNLYS